MTIGSNYPTPVNVNGFLCRNCTDVDYAKKHTDPAHPKSGPYGIDAEDDPTVKKAPASIILFGGGLSDISSQKAAAPTGRMETPANEFTSAESPSVVGIGSQLDISA